MNFLWKVVWVIPMNKVFIYVEGNHDKIFVNFILSEYVRNNMGIDLHPIPYAQKPPKSINKSIRSKFKFEYLFLSDLDSRTHPCITSMKQERFDKYDALDYSKIIIVKEEIESWFLAGVDNSFDKFKGWEIPCRTDSIEKEDFDKIYKISFDSKNDCLKEIAKIYNFDLAIERNSSFKYFLNKLSNLFN